MISKRPELLHQREWVLPVECVCHGPRWGCVLSGGATWRSRRTRTTTRATTRRRCWRCCCELVCGAEFPNTKKNKNNNKSNNNKKLLAVLLWTCLRRVSPRNHARALRRDLFPFGRMHTRDLSRTHACARPPPIRLLQCCNGFWQPCDPRP